MRKSTLHILSYVVSIVLAIIILNSCQNNKTSNKNQIDNPKIAILFTEPHPVLTTIAESFKKRILLDIPGAVFIERHANGSKAQYPATVRAVIDEGVQILAPITTPMSIETFKQANGQIPVVFLGVTDPLGAGLVDSLEMPGACSGVSDNPPMAGVVDLVTDFLPNSKTIGIPYDPKDQPGVTTAMRTEKYATSKGYVVNLQPVTSESELRAVVRSLSDKCDAIIIGMDNLMMKNAGLIARTASDNNTPLFAADDKSVEMGAIAGVGVDYADVGTLGGEIVIDILMNSKPVGTIPVKSLQTGSIFYNSESAKLLKITVPEMISTKGQNLTTKK